jgi:hypothetical protein
MRAPPHQTSRLAMCRFALVTHDGTNFQLLDARLPLRPENALTC